MNNSRKEYQSRVGSAATLPLVLNEKQQPVMAVAITQYYMNNNRKEHQSRVGLLVSLRQVLNKVQSPVMAIAIT